MSQPSVYGVIVVRNAEDWIGQAVKSLLDSEYPITAVVVDNNSSDATVSRTREFPEAICLEQTENLGFGIGNNVGMAYALQQGADYIFLLNSDAAVAPDMMGRMIKLAEAHPAYGILSPLQLDGDGKDLDWLWSRHLARQSNPSFTQLVSDLFNGSVSDIYAVSFVNAAAWLISRRFLETAGGFDPIFSPIYGEDDDLITRAEFHGFKTGIVIGAKAIHYRVRGGSTRISRWQTIRKLSNHPRGVNINHLKNSRGSFFAGTYHWIVDTFTEALGALLHGRWKQAIIIGVAAIRTLWILPRIVRHRRICQTIGPHWLPLDAS